MGRYEERLRAVIALFNERGPEMYDDPDVLSATRAWIDPEIESVSAGGIQGSGVPIEETYVWAQRYEDGKAVSYAIDRDREGAMRAAGLAP